MPISSVADYENFGKPEIITGTGEILEDRSATGRLRPWSDMKKQNLELLELFKVARCINSDIISDSRFQALADCASWTQWAELVTGGRKLAHANFCRLRLCPMCAWRRSLKLFAQVSKITDAILCDKRVRFIFVTFTVRNVAGCELRDTIKRMSDGFKRLVQNKQEISASATFRKNLLGYMKAVEVTYNVECNDFHPHIHCIFEVLPNYFGGRERGYLTHSDWRQMWQSLMKLDYEPQVSVRAIKNTTAKAVAEVAKYPVKMADLLKIGNKKQAAKALIELKLAIHNCRLVTFGGDFREYKRRLALDDVESGDLVHVETDSRELNIVAYTLFKYRADVGAYIC